MSGFFGGGSAGSFLLTSIGQGDQFTFDDARHVVFPITLNGKLIAGRVLRIQAQFLFSTSDVGARACTFSLLDSTATPIFTVDTISNASASLNTPRLVAAEIFAVPNVSPDFNGGYGYEFRTPTGIPDGESTVLVSFSQGNFEPATPQDETTLSLAVQLSDDADGLSIQLLCAVAEILRAP